MKSVKTNKKQIEASYIAEKEAIEQQLIPLRAKRKMLKESGHDFSEVDGNIRRMVKRTHRIDAKLNPRAKTGCAIKVARSSSSSSTIYKTYHAAGLRPVQGGKTSPK